MTSDNEIIQRKDNIPRYEKIAVDIAYSIVNGEWEINEILKGRSTLSGKYGVSPETIRRALKLLEESEVVDVLDRKGVMIKSIDAANTFIKEFQSKDRILSIRDEISTMMTEKRSIEDSVLERLDSLIEQAILLRNVGIIYPLEFKIPNGSKLIGKSIGEIRFWEFTGATIIGINRGGQLYLSPGPKFIFYNGDIVFYVGNTPNISNKVNTFVSKI